MRKINNNKLGLSENDCVGVAKALITLKAKQPKPPKTKAKLYDGFEIKLENGQEGNLRIIVYFNKAVYDIFENVSVTYALKVLKSRIQQ